MAHKKSLTKAEWDALPEPTRKFFADEKVYVPDGDNFKLDAEGIEDTSGLKTALQKERDARTQFEKDLKAEREKFKDVDLDEYNALKAEKDSRDTDDLKSKGKVDELLENQRQKYEKLLADEKKKSADESARLNAELDRVTIDTAFRAAYEKAGVIPDRIDDAVALTRSQAKREDGKLVLYDTDGLKLDINIDTYAKEVLKNARPYLYQASANGGTGAQNGTHGANGAKTYKRADWEKLPPAQQSTVMAEVRAGTAQIVD